jgi:hypothetical protein
MEMNDGAMDDYEIRRKNDELRRLLETHCWIGRDPKRPWLPDRIVRSDIVDRYREEILTEAQIDWLIANYATRDDGMGEEMIDLLTSSCHPKSLDWAMSDEGQVMLEYDERSFQDKLLYLALFHQRS